MARNACLHLVHSQQVFTSNLRWSPALQCCLLTHLINSQAMSRILRSVPKLCMQHVLLLLLYIIADVYGSLDVKHTWFLENVMLTPHSLLCLPALLCIHLLMFMICEADARAVGRSTTVDSVSCQSILSIVGYFVLAWLCGCYSLLMGPQSRP